MHVKGATVLVTGATGGIGRAVTAQFAAAGARLVLTSTSPAALDRLAAEVGGGARCISADLSIPAQVAHLANEAGSVDVLIANAGVSGHAAVERGDLVAVQRIVSINVTAPLALTAAFLPALRARGAGHIVLVGSLAAKTLPADSALYCATKAALRTFALGLARDLRPMGVGVSVVAPGYVRDAGMFARWGGAAPRFAGTVDPLAVGDAVLRAVEHGVREVEVAPPLHRWGARSVAALRDALYPTAAALISRRDQAEPFARRPR